MSRIHPLILSLSLILAAAMQIGPLPAAEKSAPPESLQATIQLNVSQRARHPISSFITGKFCEHLWTNIYNGMDAQILRNPTLADWPFSAGQITPDGISAFLPDRDRIATQMKQQARRFGWPEEELNALEESRLDGLACFWTREGPKPSVEVSPDTGPHGGRAQRVQVSNPVQGIAQWTYLPLHRVRKYEISILARSPEITALQAALYASGSKKPVARVVLRGLSPNWSTLGGTLEFDRQAPADAAYRFALTSERPGQFVVARIMLRPADHVSGADPDVVRLLKQSRLALLRWPGGNFVSGYHWEDGIGPPEARPTRPNYAWGGIEPNTFGTDEFVAFCRAVGCEPMICVNAGSGTPEEAARWIEYCNGPADSPMGRRRAANGHPEPYRIRHWEVGNELWGRWQYHWTTAAGYVDRYEQFVKAMLAADPAIKLYACGAPAMWGKAWNDTLIRKAAPLLGTITDHPLVGGQVPAATDPMDVYRDFMAVPDALAGKWADLQRQMQTASVKRPRLAVTELQMFASIGSQDTSGDTPRLTRANLVSPGTQAEAVYDLLIYHRAVRMDPFVEMVTHSATVNHGGGLRKERERVYANPCHYAQAMFAELAGAVPVGLEVLAPREKAPLVVPDLRNVTKDAEFAVVDALAAIAPDGGLLVSLLHRGSAGPVRTSIDLGGFRAVPRAAVRTLAADVPWAANTLQSPESVKPVDSTAEVSGGKIVLEMKPFSVVRVSVSQAEATK